VNTSKTILSYEVQAGVFRFIDYQRLLEGEVGYTANEPVMLCLMSAIETGVILLINDGIDRGFGICKTRQRTKTKCWLNIARWRRCLRNPDGKRRKSVTG
jgi:curli production assembly/transport component CsgG